MTWGAAIKACNSLEYNGHADWFLPSKEQLDLAYINLKKLGALKLLDGTYWSISQVTGLTALSQSIPSGIQSYENINIIFIVRPVRSVKIEDLEFEGSEAAIVAQPPGDE